MAQSPLQTEEELLLVKELVILPVMFDVLEKDIQFLRSSSFNMFNIYAELISRIQNAALSKQYELRKQLRTRRMKLIEVKRDDSFLKVLYECRGYQHRMDLLWEVVRANIEMQLYADFHLSLE